MDAVGVGRPQVAIEAQEVAIDRSSRIDVREIVEGAGTTAIAATGNAEKIDTVALKKSGRIRRDGNVGANA